MTKDQVYYETRVMCARRNLDTATHPAEIAYWRDRLIADTAALRAAAEKATC